MLARFATTTLLLFLLSAHLAIGRDSEQFRDFSHKGSAYVPLENSKTYDSQPMTSNILALKLPTFSENHFRLKVRVDGHGHGADHGRSGRN